MKRAFRCFIAGVAALVLCWAVGADALTLQGAGATFPYPIYSQWTNKYYRLKGIKINYQSIGSGAGIAQIKAKTVDFGASDAPLEPEELAREGLIQFPMVIGGDVLLLNLLGVEGAQLRLSRDALAGIFMGDVKRWNDPIIERLNPNVRLPKRDITVVHRADGSGTTWIFTNYLSKISRSWRDKVGYGKAVKWPTGVGGKGNEGVSAYVQRIKGAIGYVEFAYAIQNRMPVALLENREGRFVSPTIETFQAAAAHADWENAPGFYVVLTDQPGQDSWPITGASFILIHKEQRDPKRAKAMLDFFSWCYRHGGEMAKRLHYVPMPDSVIEKVVETWRREISSGGRPILR